MSTDAPASPTSPAVKSSNVFVNYVPLDVTDVEFAQRFERHGTVTSSRIMRHLDKTATATLAAAGDSASTPPLARSKGYGFVMFETPEMALAAVAAEHGAPWGNKRLSVSIASRCYEDKSCAAATDESKTHSKKKTSTPGTAQANTTTTAAEKKANGPSKAEKIVVPPNTRTVSISPVVGPVHHIVQALSIFGEVDHFQIDRTTDTVNVTFDTAFHAASAVRAIAGNVVHTLHPTATLKAVVVDGTAATAAGQAAPPPPPKPQSRPSLPNMVSLQQTANTQIASYPFPTSPHVRVGGLGGAAFGWRDGQPQPHPMAPYVNRGVSVGTCPHGPHCHCGARTSVLQKVPTGYWPPTHPQQQHYGVPPFASFQPPHISTSPPQSRALPSQPTVEKPRSAGPVSNPLTAVFSKAVKEANAKEALLKQQSATASDYFKEASSPTSNRAHAAPYVPTPVHPIRDFASLPFPGANAGGYVDGYGTGHAAPAMARSHSNEEAVTCHYCADVTTVILHNTPVDDHECRRLVDEQLGQFGHIKFTECWGDGDAVVAFFQPSHAENAVVTLHESEYCVDYFDCSGQHQQYGSRHY